MDLVSLLTSTTSKGNPNAWDISKAYYDAGADAWDISKAFYSGVNFSFASQETNSAGMFFKPDGTKMYICGTDFDAVNEYTLSTPWLVSSATYVQNFSISAQDTVPLGLFFKPDGTKMYIVGSTGDDVNEYSLSSAWDVSTASYVQNFSVSAQDTTPTGIFFKDDGTKMYILGDVGNDVNEYDLSTPWDISTASYLQNFSVATQEGTPYGLFFKPGGEFMYVIGLAGDDINEYSLSTPWDISTASYVRVFSVQAQEPSPTSVFFKPDGSAFYIAGASNERVYQYTIGGFSVAAQSTNPYGITFKTDGTKMYIQDGGGGLYEYNLSSAWDVTTASFVQVASLSQPFPASIYFKPDGTKLYHANFDQVSSTYSRVNEYTLSVAWDVSTISFTRNFSVSAKETQAYGVFFKDDGTKMYVVGSSSDSVHEYSLSTAWNISTATFSQSKSVSAQDTAPWALFFKTDGTKMYVLGQTGNDINEYSLSSAWDISTATYVTTFSVANFTGETSPAGFYWKDDGLQFWVVGLVKDTVYSYTIT